MGIQRYKKAAAAPLLIVDDLAFEMRKSSRRKTIDVFHRRPGLVAVTEHDGEYRREPLPCCSDAVFVVFRKHKADDNVLFIDASREFKVGKNQNQLGDDNIAKVIETYRQREGRDKYAYLASQGEVRENDFNLNIARYVDTFKEEEEIDLMAVQAERKDIEAKVARINR